MANEGNRVRVKKEIYEWAIKESQKDFEEVKARFKNIEDWINQDFKPTFRQLEELANYLKVPFGYMFLNKPPKTDVVGSEFRSIGNKIPNISKNLKDTIYDMSRKQDWISEYRKDNGWDKVISDKFSISNENNCFDYVEEAKNFLNLDAYWYRDFNDNRVAYNFLREKIESKGIIVMQNGIVGSNTRRKLDINEFRGFMLCDEFAPLVFINTNDSQTGKIFTLVHEYIHILFEKEDVFIDADLNGNSKLENKINKITAEFLMPGLHIKNYWNERENKLSQIEVLGKLFNVSRLALAIRLKGLKLIEQPLVEKINEMTERDLENRRNISSEGGDYWTTYKSRYSNKFIETVIQGAESGDITYSYAFNLLNVKAKNYDILKEDMIGYG